MGEEVPETCWAAHKRQVIYLRNCYILLFNLFESFDDARSYERQIFKIDIYVKRFAAHVGDNEKRGGGAGNLFDPRRLNPGIQNLIWQGPPLVQYRTRQIV